MEILYRGHSLLRLHIMEDRMDETLEEMVDYNVWEQRVRETAARRRRQRKTWVSLHRWCEKMLA